MKKRGEKMYKSQQFGKIFWVDDDYNLKCCPQWADGTGDFEQTEYVEDWLDWEGVNMKALLIIYRVCLLRNGRIETEQEYLERKGKIFDATFLIETTLQGGPDHA